MPSKQVRKRRPYLGPTPELIESISQAMASGMPYILACHAYGLPSMTASDWVCQGRLALSKYKVEIAQRGQSIQTKMEEARMPVSLRPYAEFVLTINRARAISAARHVNNIDKCAMGGAPVKTKTQRIYKQVMHPVTGDLVSQLVSEVEETNLTPPSWQASAFLLTNGPARSQFRQHRDGESAPIADDDMGVGIGPGSGNGSGSGSGGGSSSTPGDPNYIDPSVPPFTVILEQAPVVVAAVESLKDMEKDEGHGSSNHESIQHPYQPLMPETGGSTRKATNAPHPEIDMQGATEYYDPEIARAIEQSHARPTVKKNGANGNGQSNGHSNGHNGNSNGHSNGHSNGNGNGHSNGNSNGHANGKLKKSDPGW